MRAAGIDEHRRAPWTAIEVVLVLGRADHQVLGAQCVLVRRRRTRADLAVGVAADAAVAAGEIAQARWHRHQVAGPGGAALAAQDQAVAFAHRDVPAQHGIGLHEAGIRTDALDAVGHHLRVHQRRGVVDRIGEFGAGGVAPALAQRVDRGDRGPVLVDLAAAAGDQLEVAQVDVIGLLVIRAGGEGVPAVEPVERRDAVAGDQALALLRIVQLRVHLVAAVVQEPPLDATAHTRAALAAVAQAGGVDGALGAGQLHVHRHVAVRVGLVRTRLDVDHAEIVQLGQRLPQAIQLALVVVAALVPVHQRVEQLVDEVVLYETHRAHVVAAATVPGQVDVCGVVGACDLHLALGVVGIEVATLGQASGDGDLAGFVLGVLEALALARLERGQVVLQVLVVDRRAAPARAHPRAVLQP
ncbi:hypothetical protein G6F31_013734 [Rhizopus arrhizus]|nr:hypothetical protein G6F31_013734 [Rhizopus arrhizus]